MAFVFLIHEAYRRYAYSMTSIAHELGLHNSTIRRIIKAKKNPLCSIQDMSDKNRKW